MPKSKDIKSALYRKCDEYVKQRIENARSAMAEAQEAANEESRSSAGDKYTTDRAMMQLEKEKYSYQLTEAIKLSKIMVLLSIDKRFEQVALGSLVYTTTGIYFIAISLGKISINGHDIFVISAVSPMGQRLINKKVHDVIDFNGRKFTINDIE